jgi:hypothetical protein
MKRHHRSLSETGRADAKSWARENASWKRKAKAEMRRWHREARKGGLHLNKLAKAGW